MYRELFIHTDLKNHDAIKNILSDPAIQQGIKDRNIKVNLINKSDNKMYLFGYDGVLKYISDDITHKDFLDVFEIVDGMPMRKKEIEEINNKNAEILKGGNLELYTDKNPGTTLKNTGFKDAATAKKTIKLIQNRSIIYQKTLINALYYRAKHFPNRTKDMEAAMKIFKKWIDQNKNKKIKYDYLNLDIVKKYEKLADYYDIAHVTRGLKKASKSEQGFLVVYKRVKGNKNKLAFIPVFKNKPGRSDYDIFREKFINSRLGQMKHAKTKLYNEDGLPTKQHVILIMHAYSPDPAGIKKKLSLLKKL